jgi:NAD(P)-dependent dehydrogenase (short-subunit alcohol dehydrogenase family)
VRLDVNDLSSVKKAVGTLLRTEKRLDAVVNNAGFAVAGFWEDLTDDDLKAQFETNVFGLLRVCRETLPALRSSGGRIVNLGSVSGFSSMPILGPYSAGKFCVRALSEALRMEEGSLGVQVTEINPGLIRTNIAAATRRSGGAGARKAPRLKLLEDFDSYIQRGMEKALLPERVAETIGRALEAKRTRRFYLVNPGSRLTYLLKWILPDACWEALIAKSLHW